MRILWHSNAPWVKTGYGIQTKLFGQKIAELGHEIHYSANYGLQGVSVQLDETSHIHPSLTSEQRDHFLLPYHAKKLNSDIVITLYDVWTFNPKAISAFRWVPLVPIQWETVPEGVRVILQGAFKVIAYSQYGVDKLQEVGIDALYLPHCIDTNIYRPIMQKEARMKLDLPLDKFIVIMVAMNKGFPSRKSFPEVLDAWSEFTRRHDDVMMHMHTCPYPLHGGVNIRSLISALGIDEKTVTLPDLYEYFSTIEPNKMALLYSAADVLLLPSRAEGFGVPLIEAQACGTPVITSNFGPMRELCFSGWLVDGQRNWHIGLDAFQFLPFTSSILSCLELAYKCKKAGKMEAMRNHAAIAAADYSVDIVTRKHLIPVLKDIEEALAGVGSLEMLSDF